MAGGIPTSLKVELEVTSSSGASWVDVSAYLDTMNGFQVQFGRPTEFDDLSTGTLSLSFLNDTGYFTPDNPTSILYPAIVEGTRIRVTVTRGATTSVRFLGRVASWEPRFEDGEPNNAVVDVTAVDYYAQLARRTFACDFVERWLTTDRTGRVDLWPLDDGSEVPASFRSATGGQSGYILAARGNVGSATMQAPEGVVLDGSLALTASFGTGPVGVFPVTQIPSGSIQDMVIPFRTSAVYSGVQLWLAHGVTAAGAVTWSVRLVDGGSGATDLAYYGSDGGFAWNLYTDFSTAVSIPGDDQWFALRFYLSGGSVFTQLVRCADQASLINVGSGASTVTDALKTQYVVVGGQNPQLRAGKQANCLTAEFGAVAVSDTLAGHYGYLQPNAVEPGQTRFADLCSYAGTVATATSGTLNRNVTLKAISGRQADECLNELARTMGGVIFPDYSVGVTEKALKLKDADVMRLSTAALTVDIEADVDAGNGIPLRRATESKPTRVTATWPGGTVTVTGDESLQRLDESVDTCAADEAGARSVASSRLNRSVATRISELSVDLVTAQNDLYAAVVALTLGDRIRVTNLPATQLGVTQADYYVQAWTEKWTADEVTFTFDPSLADSPVEGVFDDAEYGRFAADGTLSLAYPVTSGGTTLTVAPSSATVAVLTTDGSMYPFDLDVTGERCTAAGAPGTATRTNLCTNPSFETGTTGWATPGGYTAATLTASTALTGTIGLGNKAGGQALRVAWPTAASGGSAVAFSASGLTVGQRYTFSVWVIIPGSVYGGANNVSPMVTACETAGAGTSVSSVNATSTARDAWQRLDVSLTASLTTHSFGIKTAAASSTTTTDRVYVDAVLLEKTTSGVGTYFDGDIAGSWTGTAHASTATQTVQTVTVTRGVSPTVARAHGCGDNVEVWHAAAFAF